MASEQSPAQAQRPCGAKTSNDMQTSIKGCRCASLLLCRVQRHERWSEAIPVNLFLQGDRFREGLTPSYALLLRPDDENSVRGHFAVTQLLGSVAMRTLRQGKDDAMWGMFAGSMAFVICGLLLLRSNFTVAIVTIAFFGSCAVVAAVDLRRKLRTRSPAPERVKLIGGVPLRPSRLLIGGIGIWMAALGLILATFGAEEGLIIQGIGLGLAALGCVMLIGMALGRLPADFLQFDPSGITLGRRGFAYLVRWDNIAGLGTGEIGQNPAILIRLHRPDAIEVSPPQRKTRALKELARCESFCGAPVVLMTMLYRMDATLLAQALDRYVREPHARDELSVRLIDA
jgi:hypothetical protein